MRNRCAIARDLLRGAFRGASSRTFKQGLRVGHEKN